MTFLNIADVANTTIIHNRDNFSPIDIEYEIDYSSSITDGIMIQMTGMASSIASISTLWDSVMKTVEEKQKDAWEILSTL